MQDADAQRLLALLEEIRRNQERQIEAHAEVIALERQRNAREEAHFARQNHLLDRAEATQDRGERMFALSRKLVWVIVALIVATAVLAGFVQIVTSR